MGDIYPRNIIRGLPGSRGILFPATDFTGDLLNLFLFYPVPGSKAGTAYGPGADYAVLRFHDVQINSYEGETTLVQLQSRAGIDLTQVNSEVFTILCDPAVTLVSFYYVTGDMTTFYKSTTFLYDVAQAILTYSMEDTTVKYVGGRAHVMTLLQSDFREMVEIKNESVKLRAKDMFKTMLSHKVAAQEEPYSTNDPVPSFPQVAKDFIKLEAARLIASVEGTIPVTYPGFHPSMIDGTVAIFSKDDDMYFGNISGTAMNFVANGISSTTFSISNIKSIKNMLRLSNQDCAVFESSVDIPPFTTRSTQYFSSGFDWRQYAMIDLSGFISYYYTEFALGDNERVKVDWYQNKGSVFPLPEVSLLSWIILATDAKAASGLSSAEVKALQTSMLDKDVAALKFLWTRIVNKSIRVLEPFIFFPKDSALPEETVAVTEWQKTVYIHEVFPDIDINTFDYVLPRTFLHAKTPDIKEGADILGQSLIEQDNLIGTYAAIQASPEFFKEDVDTMRNVKITPFKFDSAKPVSIASTELVNFIRSVRTLPPYRYNWWKSYNKGKGYIPIQVIHSVDLRLD